MSAGPRGEGRRGLDPTLSRALRPCQLGSLTLRNRIVKAATFEGRARDGEPGRDLAAFHARIAFDAGFDMVALGRALLYDPDLCHHLVRDATYQSGCTHCNECVASMAQPGGTRCTVAAVS